MFFDLRAGCVRLAYAGPSLPPTEDVQMVYDAQVRGRDESQFDTAVPASLLMQNGATWLISVEPA
jgi:hypothetical protein